MDDTLSHRLSRLAKQSPERLALSDKGRQVSYFKLEALIQENFEILQAAGYTGGRVALVLPHGLEHAIWILTLIKFGVPGLSVDLSLPESRRSELFEALGVSMGVFLDSTTGAQQNSYKCQVCRTSSRIWRDNYSCWTLMTSGSTGRPKEVEITQDEILSRSLIEVEIMNCQGIRSLGCLKFHHDVGFIHLVSCILSGSSLHLEPFVFPATILKILRENAFQALWGTPLLWTRLLGASGSENISDTLEKVTISAGSLPLEVQKELQRKLPNAQIFRTYGQTETFRSLYSVGVGDSFSRIIPGVDLKLVDKFGSEVPFGEQGELQHNGLSTGDIFHQRSDGSYVFVGRQDDMIKRYHQRFYPIEVETLIGRIDGVREVFVFKDPNSQNLFAVVEFSGKNKKKLEIEIFDLCHNNIEQYKVPTDILFLEEFPRLLSGKVNKRALKERVLAV